MCSFDWNTILCISLCIVFPCTLTYNLWDHCADTGSWIRGQIPMCEGKYYYWTCKNEHIATKYAINKELPFWSTFTPVFIGVRVTRPLVLCVMFCRSLFFLSAIVLSDSDYAFSIFKLFLPKYFPFSLVQYSCLLCLIILFSNLFLLVIFVNVGFFCLANYHSSATGNLNSMVATM
jgi:hypothetical protein